MRRIAAVTSVAVCLAFAPRVRAQDHTAFAQQRFSRGAALYEAHDYPGALEEFRASIALYGSPNTRLYLARCLRELGRLDEAVPEFERAMHEAGDRAARDPRYVQTRDAAHEELLQVAPRVARLTLTVPGAPASAVVRVNEREVPVAALGIAIPVMPGSLRVTFDALGYEHEERTIDVAAGSEGTLGIVLRRRRDDEGHTQVAVRRPVTPLPPAPRRGFSRDLGWIGVGVTGLGVIGFGAFYALSNARFDDLTQRCAAAGCASLPPGDIDGGRTLQTMTNVSIGVGVAGAATAVILFVVGRPRTAPPVAVSVGPSHVGVAGVF